MSRDERLELRDFIDITLLGTRTAPLSNQQKDIIRRRAAEMNDDPNLGASWDEVYTELMADMR